ncbi:ankyrin repeat domain-containing protein 17 isoform X3 [Cardiocondyla obscurior]|uniref:ankyrin repeat domain-containing protein 17 isoform X3 n=1 Tax=Cardiocondyla obscurior TaxID=286306 RepID=UPI00396561BE
MQNVAQSTTSDSQKSHEKQSAVAAAVAAVPAPAAPATAQPPPPPPSSSIHHDTTGKTSSTPQSSNSSPTKSETETFSELQPRFMTDSSESEEDSVSEVECFAIDQVELDEDHPESSKFLLTPDDPERSVDPETQARLEALLEAAGIGKLSSADGKHLPDHEVLRRLTSSVSCALDEAAAALTRMRSDNPRTPNEKRSLVEACTDGDVGTVRKLLTEGRSVHETTEEGESLLSLACSAGYYELAQVLLAMNANVEDRGIKGDCTPLMEAASAGHVDIVTLLIAHGADVNAQSTSGNTPLMYGCAGGHEEVVRVLLDSGANVEDHNENGHTPLMEAASAGHVQVAKILLERGAGINTHSNEFKESALTLACYKGHLEMVRFLLEAGADQEHKTDEMHTALMEASMDGHVEVARLLLDSGAQVNMPTDSFESPLTLAACGGHVDLAMLLIERGANIEEVNDEGYTPLMEAAREGHEEMVALLLSQGANINAQTEETQETALTLACCGGFLEVADFLIKAGADIELGASTPLMEAAQEGHLDLVRYLLESAADVHAQTQTGDTALTYACENGHTDVADLLLQFGADLEHESEGGRTPLMKACRAGHLCTVQFLISKRADVNRQTTNNDHTPLSLACAGGHLAVVELLLAQSANPFHKLKDSSTMLIEAAKGGHTSVVQLLLDYPHSIMMSAPHNAAPAPMLLPQQQPPPQQQQPQSQPQPQQHIGHQQHVPHSQQTSTQPQHSQQQQPQQQTAEQQQAQNLQPKHNTQKSLLRKNRSVTMMPDMSLTSAEAQQVRSQPAGESTTSKDDTNILDKGSGGFTSLSEPNISLSPTPAASTQVIHVSESRKTVTRQEQILDKQRILEELQDKKYLQRVERELQIKGAGHVITSNQRNSISNQSLQDPLESDTLIPPNMLNIDLPTQSTSPQGIVCNTSGMSGGSLTYPVPNDPLIGCPSYLEGTLVGVQNTPFPKVLSIVSTATDTFTTNTFSSSPPPPLSLAPLPVTTTTTTMSLISATSSTTTPSPPSISTPPALIAVSQSPITASSDVSQNTAISDRPKAKPVSKKEGKNVRKATTSSMGMAKLQQTQATIMAGLHQQYQQKQRPSYQVQQVQQLQQLNQQLQLQLDQVQIQQQSQQPQSQPPQPHQQIHSQQQTNIVANNTGNILMPTQLMSHLHPTHHHLLSQQAAQENLSEQTDPELTRKYRESACAFFTGAQKSKTFSPNERVLKLDDGTDIPIDDAFEIFRSISFDDAVDTTEDQEKLELKRLDVSNNKELQQQQQHLHTTQIVQQGGSPHGSQEYFTPVLSVPPSVSLPALPSLQVTSAGVQIEADISAGLQLTSTQSLQNPTLNNRLRAFEEGFRQGSIRFRECIQQHISSDTFQPQLLLQSSQMTFPTQTLPAVSGATGIIDSIPPHQSGNYMQSTTCNTNQVQVATQTQAPATTTTVNVATSDKKQVYTAPTTGKGKKARYPLLSQQQSCQQQQTANAQQAPNFPAQNYQLDPSTGAPTGGYASNQASSSQYVCMEVDSETDSNHDTALTLACAGGHEDLVELLLSRGSNIEHRDKKGFTPLILAATAGHQKVVEILLNHGADIEAQSERTKDTPLSLACSGGRYEVVELLLNRGANKEHRNVSDYTPLSLAASGGYVNIIKLLLSHGAEINSRTGSKLGISPLMLAAMNGHTAAVKLLLDMGSDINAQIETNRNTALTLACFQGRHEVVSLLLDRKANVEHRAKTGLTPLMEAASGGYVEVGRVLLAKGADVNATPVPSSRDTALTIAADKGHCRFVELLLSKGTQVEVKNKKGNSPLWLAANGGHLNVVDLLYHAGADIDSQDNRKVSCLMAAFRKGHIKVVKWMVNHVTQFPSDQEMTRYIATVSDKELLEKCQECVKVIRAAKETQAAKANKNATILLEELDMEKTREESKKAAAARRRERKKKKKLEKKEEKRKLHEEYKKNETTFEDKEENGKKSDEECDRADDSEHEGGDERMESVPSPVNRSPEDPDREEGDSGIDANSQGSCSSNDVKAREKKKEKKKKKNNNSPSNNDKDTSPQRSSKSLLSQNTNLSQNTATSTKSQNNTSEKRIMVITSVTSAGSVSTTSITTTRTSTNINSDRKLKGQLVFESSLRHPADREDFEATGNETYVPGKGKKSYNNQYDGDTLNTSSKASNTSPKQSGKREEGWKEVVRKGQSDDSGRFMNSPFRSKKVSVPTNAISRVIGRGGSHINAIRGATGAHIEVEKQSKCQVERVITIKGSSEATKQAHSWITLLIKEPDVDILQLLPKSKLSVVTTSSWDKSISTVAASKTKIGPVNKPPNLTSTTSSQVNKSGYPSGTSTVNPLAPIRSSSSVKLTGAFSTSLPRATAPRLIAAAEKRAQAAAQMASSSNTKTTMSYTSAIMTAGRAGTKIVTTSTTQTFAAKLSEITASTHSSTTVMQSTHTAPLNKQQKPMAQTATVTIMSTTSAASAHTTSQQQQSIVSTSPKHCRSLPTLSSTPSAIAPHYPGKSSYPPGTIAISSQSSSNAVVTTNCPESSIVSTSASSVRVTSSPPVVPLQPQALPPPLPAAQQQQPQMQQQSQQGIRSTTPVVTREHQQQQQQQQQQQPSSTPLEYSLFNDTFTKVTQQSMWGGRENETQKGMNFATVAGGGVSSNTNSGPSTAKFDSSPPQVDASKAPGYRGTAMCSPVSSKPGSTNNAAANVIGTAISGSVHNNPIQPAQFQSSTNYNEHPLPNKPPGSLAVARPVISQNIDMGAGMTAQFRPAVFQGDLTTRNATTHQPAAHVIPSTSQPPLDVSLFKTANSSGGGNYEHPNVNSNLLKMMPNDTQSGTGHSLLPFHPHMQSFAQTIAPSASVINTTVSMSRLNPRAPDFSSSLHLNKPQVTVFNTVPRSAGLHPTNMFAATVPGPPPSAIQSNNLAMLGNYPLGKYQAPSQATPTANTGISTTAQTTRWPFATPAPHTNYPPQDSMISQMAFSNQLANIGNQPGGTIDLITSLENGGSPAISPSSPAQVAQEMSQLKIEDRKVPRPIGTERAWKNYSATGMGPGGDADSIGWMLNDKLAWSNCNLAPNIAVERQQTVFRSNPNQYNQRLSNVDPELHQMVESSFQGHMNTQSFPTNGNTPLSLMPLTLLPGQGFGAELAEIPPNEQNKIDPPAWGMHDAVQDKQHQAWTKWTH